MKFAKLGNAEVDRPSQGVFILRLCKVIDELKETYSFVARLIC